ncbi:MAG: hypothetical protein ABF289_18450 [Clostridiales bacterium]
MDRYNILVDLLMIAETIFKFSLSVLMLISIFYLLDSIRKKKEKNEKGDD